MHVLSQLFACNIEDLWRFWIIQNLQRSPWYRLPAVIWRFTQNTQNYKLFFFRYVWSLISLIWEDSINEWLACLGKLCPGIKVEKILEDSLDSISSNCVKIQIMGGKVSLSCKGKTLLGVVNKLLKTKSLLTSPSNVLPYYLKETFPSMIWIFTKVEGDGINKLFVFKGFAFTAQAYFPAHNLNFHWSWRWWNGLQAIFLNLLCFNIIW